MRGAVRLRTAWYGLRYRGVLTLGAGVRISGRLRIVGDGHVTLGDRVRVDAHNGPNELHVPGPGGRITVGADSYLNGMRAYAGEPVEVGERCIIGDCWLSTSDFHSVQRDRHTPGAPVRTGPIRIEDNVWIANRTAVLRGVTVGADSVVGYGTIVTRDIPSGVVVSADHEPVIRPLS